MKKWFVFAMLFSSGIFASQNCRVFIPSKTFYHDSGVAIDFEFDGLLKAKHYLEVNSKTNADFILDFKGVEDSSRRFQRAVAIMTFENLKTGKILELKQEKKCFTILCSIYDYRVAFTRIYHDLENSLSNCKF